MDQQFVLTCASDEDAVRFIQADRAAIFCLDGASMVTAGEMYAEFKQKCGFPVYSASNFDALIDSLSDLDLDFGAVDRIYIIIERSNSLLMTVHPHFREVFFEVLGDVGVRWAEPIARGEWWDRQAIEFKVVLIP